MNASDPSDRFPPSVRSRRAVVLGWSTIAQRHHELARLLQGEALIVYPVAPHAALRYGLSIIPTWRAIRSLRSGDVAVVTAPPVLAAATSILAARPGVAVILDSHPGAFGLMGDRLSRRLSWLHNWCVRHARLTLVTTEALVSEVVAKGGRGLVFHEAPSADRPSDELPEDHSVVFPGTFARDEPIDLVLGAAQELPQLRFYLTGDQAKAPALDFENVILTGWLDPVSFAHRIQTASIVLVLTDEPQSVMRTAYEAVRARRPLVVTRTAATEAYFPHSWLVANDARAIANAVQEIATADASALRTRVAAAEAHSRRLTEQQVRDLFHACP